MRRPELRKLRLTKGHSSLHSGRLQPWCAQQEQAPLGGCKVTCEGTPGTYTFKGTDVQPPPEAALPGSQLKPTSPWFYFPTCPSQAPLPLLKRQGRRSPHHTWILPPDTVLEVQTSNKGTLGNPGSDDRGNGS